MFVDIRPELARYQENKELQLAISIVGATELKQESQKEICLVLGHS